jgi:hypothetical protein
MSVAGGAVVVKTRGTNGDGYYNDNFAPARP